MKKNKILLSSILVALIIILIIGGYNFMRNKTANISMQQQKNIASRIIRSYKNVHEIEFIKSYRDEITGTVGINFKLNNNDKYVTGIVVKDFAEFNNSNGIVRLSPIDTFEELGITDNAEDAEVSLNSIHIKFLGE